MLLNSKIDKYSYRERIDNIDSFPYTRKLFSDGGHSFINFLLGYLTSVEPMIAPFFLGYEAYKYKPYDNTTTESLEFVLGYMAGSFFPITFDGSPSTGEIPNFFRLKMLGLI